MSDDPMRPDRPTRVPLGRNARRLSFERRVWLWLAGLGVPGLVLAGLLAWAWSGSAAVTASVAVGFALLWWLAASYFLDFFTRPLNTLTNVVAALREDDYSFRARGAQRGDAVGDLALEINTLAGTLQAQRVAALDALTLVERVLGAMPSPVLAFDDGGLLRLHNPAARGAFGLQASDVGRAAEALGLRPLLEVGDQGLYAPAEGATPWSVRRASFRLRGLPHTLFVLSDVSLALRREERAAFQRLIRVMSHEITNSLTPIQSIAGTLRGRLAKEELAQARDLLRGLTVIEDRATSLHRFLGAYQRLARMPEPALRPVQLAPLLAQVVALETRVPAALVDGPEVTVLCDPDQVQQALINLLRNAADAALAQADEPAAVEVAWQVADGAVAVKVLDNGLGLLSAANLFVPFYTTKPEGSGIGLALAQQVASVHGGAVSLRNRTDARGCVAELSLPLVPGVGGAA